MEQIIKITARSNFEKEEYGFNPRLAVGVGDPESAKKMADEIERKNKLPTEGYCSRMCLTMRLPCEIKHTRLMLTIIRAATLHLLISRAVKG